MDINEQVKQDEREAGSACVFIKFRIRGDLRYLSHKEMMRVFERAFARAGLKIKFSQGFNPHPRMSLVLPRSVGVESEDELLCLWLEEGQESFNVEILKKEMPQGLDIISAEISRKKNVPEPKSVRYVIKAKSGRREGPAKDRISELLARDKIPMERRGDDSSRVKIVDVRPFLKSISEEGEDLFVDCEISPSGTIRVDEILDLLQLKVEDLAGPVVRKSVQWKCV